MKLLVMKRPTPCPSQEGSNCSSASSWFPSWEGLGVGSGAQCTASKSCRGSIKDLAAHARFLRRAFSSSPRDAGAGRGPRRGASNVPPLPVPLLHPMEEREYIQLRPCGRQFIRGFLARIALLSVSCALLFSFSAFGKEVEEKQTLRKTFAFDETAGAR